MKVRGGVEV